MRSHAHRSKSFPLAGWKRVIAFTLAAIVGLVLLVMLVGSPIAKAIVNRKLAGLPTYAGHVDAVKLQLWRGGIEVDNFVLSEREHPDDVPLVRAKSAALAFSWGALFRGKLGGNAVIESPQVTMVKRELAPPKDEAKDKAEKKEEQKQKVEAVKAEVRRWQDVLAQAFPMEISTFEIRNGVVRFIDRAHVPQVDIGLESIHLMASGLGNRPEVEDGPLPAKMEVQGITTGNGKLKVTAQADLLAKQPRFAVNFELREMELPAFNSFLLAYTDADVSRGTFELFMEVNAANGSYEGYTKPFFKDLDFKNPSDKDKNVAQRVKEKVISAVSSVLKNDEEKKIATKVPFAGNFADNKVDVWTAIVNLLRNAFVQGLRGGFEGQPPPKPAGG
ncbi:MAG: DUF748 domain-containing protein [Opitutaceae bacterium]